MHFYYTLIFFLWWGHIKWSISIFIQLLNLSSFFHLQVNLSLNIKPFFPHLYFLLSKSRKAQSHYKILLLLTYVQIHVFTICPRNFSNKNLYNNYCSVFKFCSTQVFDLILPCRILLFCVTGTFEINQLNLGLLGD